MKYINLQLFADGDAGTVSADAGADTSSLAQSTDTAEVPVDGASQVATDRKSFDDLIASDYKEDYEKKLKENMDKRFASSKRDKEIINSIMPAINLLAPKYGVDMSNPDGIDYGSLASKILDDNEFYEQEALERGMDVEQFKQMRRMERENQELKAQNQNIVQRRLNDEKFQKLSSEAEQLKATYPSFDLDKEMQNPTFERMVWGAGVPVKAAYEAMHMNEIMQTGMQVATQKTAQMISNNIQSGQNRPVENGTSGKSPATPSTDSPKNWSKSKLDEYKKRVLRGEKITL